MSARTLVDRDAPRRQLRALLTRLGPSMVLVYGRRRVGKTFLLGHTWPARRVFYFVAAETTAAINRAELVGAIARHFGLALDAGDYPSWRTVFQLLFGLAAPAPLAIVLDEFQYLVDADPSIPSQLSAIYDVTRDRRPLVLALSGSVVRTMEQLATGGAPLYGRLAATIRLEPFDYWDAARMMPSSNPRTLATTYGIYGGTPRYLATLQDERPSADHVASDVLAPGGEVRTQMESLIDQERGLRNTETYKAVLAAIAAGRTQQNEIAQFIGVETGTPLRAMLDTLMELGYLTAHRNLDAKRTTPFRYSLADPALRFHAALVARYRSELTTTEPQEVWRKYIAPQMDQYMGLTFERIVEQAYYRFRAAKDLPTIERWGRWEGTDKTGAQREIDIVARTTDGAMITGAVKWGVLDGGVHARHLRALEALAESGREWAHTALAPDSLLLYVTGTTFAPDVCPLAESSGHPVILWTLDDLYASHPNVKSSRRRAGTRKTPLP